MVMSSIPARASWPSRITSSIKHLKIEDSRPIVNKVLQHIHWYVVVVNVSYHATNEIF